MDRAHFDQLTRSCVAQTSRRALSQILVGLALGSATRVVQGDEAAAKNKKRKNKPCSPCKKRKQGTCKPKSNGTVCDGGICRGGACNPAGVSPPTRADLPPTRQVVTQTFSNTELIAIPGADTFGIANPYPSSIVVSGFTNGTITDVNLILNNVNLNFPDDVDILLAATHIASRNAIVMSDVGGRDAVTNITLTLDDSAAPLLDVSPLVSGAFQPTNIGGPSDISTGDLFPAPAPIPTHNSLLSTFTGQNPNGTWQLWVLDDAGGDTGNLAGGLALQITAEVDVQIQERVKKEGGKKGRR